jgi:flavodoxin/ferredoxin
MPEEINVKTLVIYFSQTQNTRKIGEKIRDGIESVTGQCDFTPLKNVKIAELAEYQLIGIGFPVHYYKEPFNVTDFLESLPQQNNRHWFAFCTHGTVIGNTFPSIAQKLTAKKATVIGYFNSYAGIAVPYYPRPSYTSGHPDALDFEQAEQFGRDMVDRSQRIKNNRPDLIPAPEPVSSREWIKSAERTTLGFLKQHMPKLTVDPDKCIQCEACQKRCPVGGIDIYADPPKIQEPCIYCWHCTLVCPFQAIRADWENLEKIAPDNYARYRRELDKVSADGQFRWLMDPEKINFDDPLHKQLERGALKSPKPADLLKLKKAGSI